MGILSIVLIIAVISALVIGWLVVRVIAMIVRLLASAIAAPFRVAIRASSPRPQKHDDVLCPNRICKARLPAEARFCARCGGRLPSRHAVPQALLVDVRRPNFSQVA